MPVKRVTIGKLETLHVKQNVRRRVIVLFHGFGANAPDLLPLHTLIRVKEGTEWFFPNGILEIGGGSRAWFPLMASNISAGYSLSTPFDFSQIVPSGLSEAKNTLDTFFTALEKEYQIFPKDIIIGGFSQGAMLSLDYFLETKRQFAGIILLSGTLICESVWKELAKEKKRVQFFQSHGTQDPILSFEMAKRVEELLRSSGWTGEFVAFEGGHEIPPPVMKRLSQYVMNF
jgi:phospholipase/carboxylesterase